MSASTKGRKFPAETLSVEEVGRLLKVPSLRAPTGVRNRALLVVGYRSGLRCAEALALYPKDVDLAAGSIRVMSGKGLKSRTVGLDPAACAIVQRWVDRRAELGVNGHHRLFCTLDGKPLQPAYVRNLMRRLGQKAGIEKRVHYHGLRHTYASEQAREGVPVNEIQANLGHASLAVTGAYLAHIAPHERIETARQREWNAAGV